MTIHTRITPDRALVEAYLAENPITICPSQFRQPKRKASAPKRQPGEPEVSPAGEAVRIRPPNRPTFTGPRTMSIEAALHWAFVTEKAQIDFDHTGAHEFDRVGIDPLWRGMQMAILGTAVDGGGSSNPAVDAVIIASAVESLPIELGGARMATLIAELSRNLDRPDWGQSDRPAAVPNGWDWDDDAGEFLAGTSKEGTLWTWRDKRSRKREARGVFCPISYTGTARMINAKRQAYLAWYEALLYLAERLNFGLHTIELTDAMPPLTPWRA